jgi:hypothetical protein
MTRFSVFIVLAGVLAPGCAADDPCLAFDFAPPSALFTLTNRDTGEPICDVPVEAEDGRLILVHVERCEYEMPEWFLDPAVTLQASGFGDEPVTFPSPAVDDCGEVEAPAPQAFELEPENP